MIRQHLCQYTTLRHETDMFNQSVSATSAVFCKQQVVYTKASFIHPSIHPSVLFHLSNSGSIPASIGQEVGWPHSYGSYNTYERWTHLYSTSCDLCFPNKLYLGSGLGPLLGLFYYLGSNSLIV